MVVQWSDEIQPAELDAVLSPGLVLGYCCRSYGRGVVVGVGAVLSLDGCLSFGSNAHEVQPAELDDCRAGAAAVAGGSCVGADSTKHVSFARHAN